VSVCPIRPLQQHAAGLLLWAPQIGVGDIDRLLRQARPPFDPYPQQHGGQQQMRAV